LHCEGARQPRSSTEIDALRTESGEGINSHTREIAWPRVRKYTHADVAAAPFPFGRKMQESLILQAKLESHVMMKLPLHAAIENRIRCVNDSRSALPHGLFASVARNQAARREQETSRATDRGSTAILAAGVAF
jgi:hypothetical protein